MPTSTLLVRRNIGFSTFNNAIWVIGVFDSKYIAGATPTFPGSTIWEQDNINPSFGIKKI